MPLLVYRLIAVNYSSHRQYRYWYQCSNNVGLTVVVKSLFPYRSRTMVVVRTSVRFRTVRNVAEVRSITPTSTHSSMEVFRALA